MDLCEFKASLVYRVSSRTARTVQRKLISKKIIVIIVWFLKKKQKQNKTTTTTTKNKDQVEFFSQRNSNDVKSWHCFSK